MFDAYFILTVIDAGTRGSRFNELYAPRIGFLAAAHLLEKQPQTQATKTLIFNNYLDAFVCGLFLVLVSTILIDSARQWYGLLKGTRDSTSTETPFVQSTLAPGEI